MSARTFLDELESSVEAQMPNCKQVTQRVRSLHDDPHDDKDYATVLENAFLGEYVLPVFHDQLSEALNSEEAATEALLFESYDSFDKAGGSPSRNASVPLTKQLKKDAEECSEQWRREGNESGHLSPDMGIQEPAPHSVIIESKYSQARTTSGARRKLVRALHETFFYRSLPDLNEEEHGTSWSFDYGCLIAYDTQDRVLQEAWESFKPEVRNSLWSSLRVKVMLFGG